MKLKIISSALSVTGCTCYILSLLLNTNKALMVFGVVGFAASLWLEYLILKKK